MSRKTFTPVDHIADAKRSRKTRQAFYTPLALVARMVEEARVYDGVRALEPSAGDGRIVHALIDAGATVDACETDPGMSERCASLGASMVGGDFLKYRPDRPYQVIVMNPPFTRRQDAKHIEHAYSMLSPYGRLVAVASFGLGETIADGALHLPGCQHATFEELPADTFSESGANVKTILVSIDGAHEPREVEGFKNWATYNAAVTIASDGEGHAVKGFLDTPGLFRSRYQAAIAKQGGSVYGVDWQEVAEYVCMTWGTTYLPDAPKAEPEAPSLFPAKEVA